MVRTERTKVTARITRTLHDGKNMIVLKAGEPVVVAVTSVPFLLERDAIEPEGAPVS